eukprot:scaffold286102_cov30-Tisochrysis_lutea.AAC.2
MPLHSRSASTMSCSATRSIAICSSPYSLKHEYESHDAVRTREATSMQAEPSAESTSLTRSLTSCCASQSSNVSSSE